MARPVTEKIIRSQKKQKQERGGVCVPEAVCARRNRTRPAGKTKKGAAEAVPTRVRRKKTELPGSEEGVRVGLTGLLELAGRESGIDWDLGECFDEEMSRQVVTAARCLACEPGSLARIGMWQRTHPAPAEAELTGSACRKLFEALGADEDALRRYYRLRSVRAGESDVLACDFPLQVCRDALEDPDDPDGLGTARLLVLFSLKTHEPVAMAVEPGNLPDVVSVRNALKKLRGFSANRAGLVTGSLTEETLSGLVRARIGFLAPVPVDVPWIAELLDENRGALGTFSSICSMDPLVHGIDLPAGGPGGKALHVFLYFNPSGHARDAVRLAAKLAVVRSQLLSGVSEFRPGDQKFVDRFFEISGRGRIRARVDERAFAEAKKNFGCFALLSSRAAAPRDALEHCRIREAVEEAFPNPEAGPDGEESGAWWGSTLKGRLFCQFVALGYRCFLRDLVRDVKTLAQKAPPDKTEEERDTREALFDWLGDASLEDVLDRFDALELAPDPGAAPGDRLFFALARRVIEERRKVQTAGPGSAGG